MSRYFITPFAKQDLETIKAYLDRLPAKPALEIGLALQRCLGQAAAMPMLDSLQSELSRRFGEEIRTFLCGSYRLFYAMGPQAIEIVGVLHTAQNVTEMMRGRLQ